MAQPNSDIAAIVQSLASAAGVAVPKAQRRLASDCQLRPIFSACDVVLAICGDILKGEPAVHRVRGDDWLTAGSAAAFAARRAAIFVPDKLASRVQAISVALELHWAAA